METKVCPACGSQIATDLPESAMCVQCQASTQTQQAEEWVMICQRCCHFAIVDEGEAFCAMCRGEMLPIMKREQWFSLSERDREKETKKYIELVKASFKYSEILHKQYGNRVRVDRNVMVYCPRCGEYTSAHFASGKQNACSNCGMQYQHTDALFHDVIRAIQRGQAVGKSADGTIAAHTGQFEKAVCEYLLATYLEREPNFDLDAMKRRLEKKGL